MQAAAIWATIVALLPASTVSAGLGSPPFGLAAGQTFVGHYTCASKAWLFLTVETATAEAVEAVFHFVYPGSTQHGAFTMHGTWVSGRILKLVPGDWLRPPPEKVVPIGLAGLVMPAADDVPGSADPQRIKGEVLHMGCGEFEAIPLPPSVPPPSLPPSSPPPPPPLGQPDRTGPRGGRQRGAGGRRWRRRRGGRADGRLLAH